MTNKSLSQQLCEACGIEPIKLYGCEFKNLSEYGITWGVDVCPAAEDESIKCEQCKHSKVADFLYPDFENNNNNFVKLLEIVSKKSSVSFCHNGTYYGCSIHYFYKDIFEAVEGTLQHNFLNTLLVQDLRNPCKPKLLEQIKQAIKNEQWEI